MQIIFSLFVNIFRSHLIWYLDEYGPKQKQQQQQNDHSRKSVLTHSRLFLQAAEMEKTVKNHKVSERKEAYEKQKRREKIRNKSHTYTVWSDWRRCMPKINTSHRLGKVLHTYWLCAACVSVLGLFLFGVCVLVSYRYARPGTCMREMLGVYLTAFVPTISFRPMREWRWPL